MGVFQKTFGRFLLVAAFIFAGCTAAQIQEDIDLAQAKSRAAHEANIHERFPDEVSQADFLLEKAHKSLNAGDYRSARKECDEAAVYLDLAVAEDRLLQTKVKLGLAEMPVFEPQPESDALKKNLEH